MLNPACKKAFTIIELLVVISVLVILISIAIPRFKGVQDSGRIAQVQKELQTLQGAVESYKTFTGNYPSYNGTVGSPITNLVANYLSTANPQIVATPIYDPFYPTQEYRYILDPSLKTYIIYSLGPNGDTSLSISTPDDCSTGDTWCPADNSVMAVTNGKIAYGCSC